MINYDLDQQQKLSQIDGAAEHYQDQWENGYQDGLWRNWKGCKYPSANCSRYCAYFHGYSLGINHADRQAKQDRQALGVGEYEF